MNVADQFKGLPMADLIGAPLSAAVTANLNMAKSTADFINQVGFEQRFDPDTKQLVPGKARMVDFEFHRPNVDKDGNRVLDLVKLSAPMLAIVPIPSLQVENVDITFDMEVKSATTSEDSNAKSGSISATVSGGTAFFKGSVTVNGSISASQKNTRSTDTSAKYHVEVKAVNRVIPEGLSRVLDMMNQAIKPSDVKQFKPTDQGKLPVDDKGQIDQSKGVPVSNDGEAKELPAATKGNAAANQQP